MRKNVKIPIQIYRDIQDGEIKKDKRLKVDIEYATVYAFLVMCRTIKFTVKFNKREYYDFVDLHRNKIKADSLIKEVMNKYGFLDIDKIYDNANINSVIEFEVIDIDNFMNCEPNTFTLVSSEHLYRIRYYKENIEKEYSMSTTWKSILKLYLFYVFYMARRDPTQNHNPQDYPIVYTGYYKSIAVMLGMDEKLISTITNILVDLGVIYIYRYPKNKGDVKFNLLVIATDKKELNYFKNMFKDTISIPKGYYGQVYFNYKKNR